MICPYCGKEMQKGTLTGDGRTRLRWESEGQPVGIGERLFGKGLVKAAEYPFFQFKIQADYCGSCKKMIIDTDIEN